MVLFEGQGSRVNFHEMKRRLTLQSGFEERNELRIDIPPPESALPAWTGEWRLHHTCAAHSGFPVSICP